MTFRGGRRTLRTPRIAAQKKKPPHPIDILPEGDGTEGWKVYAMASITRVPTDRQDCHHSKSAFDCAFRCINERRDISSTAKLVHAHLVTIHRTGRDETQTEIGEALGLSRHQVWRAIDELVTVGLVQTIRYGLGRPNGYVLLGIEEDDLAGRASASRPAAKPAAGQPRNPPRGYVFTPKKTNEEPGYTGPKATASRIAAPQRDFGRCTRCPHREHPGYYCSRCLCSTRDT